MSNKPEATSSNLQRANLPLVAGSLLLALGMYLFVGHVLVPQQRAEAARTQQPRGNLSDLYPRWLGTREWLLHGRDPYSADVTRDIQIGHWGRAIDPHNPNDPKDEVRFAYPAYVVFVLAPTATLSFGTAQIVFSILLALCAAASVPLWLRALGLRASPWTQAAIMLLTLGSWPVVQAVWKQQLTLLVFVLIAASAAAVVSRRLIIAGVLLALATIKPQLVAPVAAWYGVWILGDWRARRRLGWSFAGTVAVLCGAAELAMPGWAGRWWNALFSYLDYNEAEPLLQALLGHRVGQLIGAALMVGVAVAGWRRRREPATSIAFALMLMAVMTANLLVTPKWTSYDQVFLLPAVLWFGLLWNTLHTRLVSVQLTCYISAGLLGWQYLSAAALAGLAYVYSPLAQRLNVLPLISVLPLPLAIMCALAVTTRGHDVVAAAPMPSHTASAAA